jgi:molecular chaperone DnaJ
MPAPARDPYLVLGVERRATPADIKAAYRKLAMQHHPDRNQGDRSAEERFKDVSWAYAVLGDFERRAHFDRFGSAASDTPFGADATVDRATEFFESVFGDLLGFGRRRAAGEDLRYTLEIDFAEAALGCEKAIEFARKEDCRTCGGTGATGGAAGLVRCGRCDGAGELRQKAGFFATRIPCPACGGAGELPRDKCRDCDGLGLAERKRAYTVRVPAGSQGGATQRVAGEGSPGRRGGPAGDLHVTVRVRPHALLREEAGILTCELPVSLSQLALGAEVDLPALEGRLRMRVPAGTQSGAILRLRGQGLPRAAGRAESRGEARGDLHVRLVAETPVVLTDEVRGLLERLEAAMTPATLPRRAAAQASEPKDPPEPKEGREPGETT